MFKNYLQIAYRTLVKNTTYSVINITGLAVSLAASILLLLWVWDELSFDRFHSNADRIYVGAATFDKDRKDLWSVTSAPLAVYAKKEIPAVEDACRISDNGDLLIEYNNKKFSESNTCYVDPSFFSMFSFPLTAGNKTTPFANNQSVVLSATTAAKYFGKEEALGKVLKAGKANYTVTGIVKDMPANSSIRFDVLMPFNTLRDDNKKQYGNDIEADWGNFNYQTYFLLKQGSNPKIVGKQMADMHRKNQNEAFFKDLFYVLQPMTQVHLYTANGQDNGAQVVKIFFVVAVIILLIACINYINLVTARATKRSKEVSVRKVVGAGKTHLFWQFITESLLVFVIAVVLAVLLIYLVMPFYNKLSGKNLSFKLLDARVLLLFGAALLVTVLLAGVYPALTLSSFNPATALKGLVPGFGKNAFFRKTLVIIQFTCSIVLIISTVIIGQQLKYIRQKNLGFDKENIISFNSRNFLEHYDAVRGELSKQPGIAGVTVANNDIMNIGSSTGDLQWDGKTPDMANFMINQISADHNFMQVLGMKLATGEGFSGTPADSNNFIINETAVRQMHLSNPVGKKINFHGKDGVIAGVVKDFHFKNMRIGIEPCIIFFDSHWMWWKMYVKTTPGGSAAAVASIQKLWKQYNADYNFDYKFMDESFDEMYRSDIRVGELFNCFAGIAIIISCLGLFGLVTYTAETKVKEIGIRKTLGASVSNIILLLSKEFMLLVFISFLLSFPLALFMMNKWLTNYVYRTTVEWWVFAAAGFCALAIAFLTVSSKAFRAAQNNPVNALRSE